MPYDITDLMISQPLSWHLRAWMARRGGLAGAPGPRRSSGSTSSSGESGIAVANVLGTYLQVNADLLHCCSGCCTCVSADWQSLKKVTSPSRLVAAVAAGCAPHASKVPMHSSDSTGLGCHWGFKCGLGVQHGFKLETGDKMEGKGEAGENSGE
jgi:uncharacterized protein YfiM (DUF2279 family)